MVLYIVRVQLTTEISSHYTLLRDRLLKIGFTKRIKSKIGVEYRLPNGNYLIESDNDIDVIFEAVRKIALTVDKNPMIVITESKNTSWAGLEKIR